MDPSLRLFLLFWLYLNILLFLSVLTWFVYHALVCIFSFFFLFLPPPPVLITRETRSRDQVLFHHRVRFGEAEVGVERNHPDESVTTKGTKKELRKI